jgi:hypothetical protein
MDTLANLAPAKAIAVLDRCAVITVILLLGIHLLRFVSQAILINRQCAVTSF